MTRAILELAPPRPRDDLKLVRDGCEGTYWQAADGLIVRVAAAETLCDEEAAQRALLTLACRDSAAQQ